MSNARVQRVAAKMVIESEGAILALHPSDVDLNRNWQIPGGIRDDISEPLRKTGDREALEELGLELGGLASRVLRIGEWDAVDQGEDVRILAVFFHLILPKRPKVITLSDEHDDSAWLNKTNITDYQTNPEVREIVEELF